MSVPDTLRMDLADPRIYDEITLDRQQALALVNEVDSLRDQAEEAQREAERHQDAIVDAVFDLQSTKDELQQVREERDQLLAQLEQLREAVKAYGQIGFEGSELLEVMSDAREMIAKMKESSYA